MDQIPFLKPNVVKIEQYISYLEQIDDNRLYSNYGPLNRRFEENILTDFYNEIGAVTTVNNATTGLILAISLRKRENAKYAVMPSFTFSATPLAAMWCGLQPYFIDIEPTEWCMDNQILKETIEHLGEEVAVVVPYATFGTSLDLPYYQKLENDGIPVVIDAAASFGCLNENLEQFGKGFTGAVVYSFHATKAFGIGEGGIIYSTDKEYIKKIRHAANFGYVSSRSSLLLGLNGKLSEYMSAIGIATLDVYQEKISKRQEIHEWYVRGIDEIRLRHKGWELQRTHGRIPYQTMSILCPKNMDNEVIIQKLGQQGIECRMYFSPPCHKQDHFIQMPRTDLSVTEEVCSRIISLPFWEEMNQDQVKRVVLALHSLSMDGEYFGDE
ncbi:aminotransferase class I/II-fold pyridoxal phosphate-dependent enzyme [Brevibacillus sp. 179-C 1.1 NHS]|uniref:aminotransferase class I/II-fold pyridoxal phosphate-dependent enzyme n=1 Tax=Brevibacillus sp. 179-C 1.1 NHS TaxID=3235177 RepID=UPI0039A29617